MLSFSCVPLSQCQPYSGLLKTVKSQDSVANKTEEDWMGFLSQHSCGYLANETKIQCPVEDGNLFVYYLYNSALNVPTKILTVRIRFFWLNTLEQEVRWLFLSTFAQFWSMQVWSDYRLKTISSSVLGVCVCLGASPLSAYYF